MACASKDFTCTHYDARELTSEMRTCTGIFPMRRIWHMSNFQMHRNLTSYAIHRNLRHRQFRGQNTEENSVLTLKVYENPETVVHAQSFMKIMHVQSVMRNLWHFIRQTSRIILCCSNIVTHESRITQHRHTWISYYPAPLRLNSTTIISGAPRSNSLRYVSHGFLRPLRPWYLHHSNKRVQAQNVTERCAYAWHAWKPITQGK
jgi:hypothetical protein